MNHSPSLILERDQPVLLHEKRPDRSGRARLSRLAVAAACVFSLGLQCAASYAQELRSRASVTDDAHPALIFDSHVERSGWTAHAEDIDATDESDMPVGPSGVPGFPPGTRVEQYQVGSVVTANELNWGTENFGIVEIPKFDTLGDTRQLLQVRYSYLFGYNYIVRWQESTYDVPTYAYAWEEVGHEVPPFTTEFMGVPPDEGARSGDGALRPPYDPARIFPRYPGFSIGYEDEDEDGVWLPDINHAGVVEDLNDVAALIGTGTAQFPTRWFAYEPEISDWVPPGVPPFPPETLYTPELISAEFVGASDELVVYYIYAVGDPIFDDGFEEPSPR
jgi:hypothetical protein